MTTSDIVFLARRTLSDRAARLILFARAFESRHRDLLDALAAGAVTLLAIAGWCAAFALFTD